MAKYSEYWFEQMGKNSNVSMLKFRHIDDENPLNLGSGVELYQNGVVVAGQIAREVSQRPICKEGQLVDPRPRVYQVRLPDGKITTASVGAFQNIICRGESIAGF